VHLTNWTEIIAYNPSEGHNLQEHYVVMVKRGKVRDLPSLKYHCIRGVKDLQGILGWLQSKSKYGTKNPKIIYEFIFQIIEFQLCFWFIPQLLLLIKTLTKGKNEKKENWPSFWPFSGKSLFLFFESFSMLWLFRRRYSCHALEGHVPSRPNGRKVANTYNCLDNLG
jgi:hypothetical protein